MTSSQPTIQLTNAGAAVTVTDYEGGHGWNGDVWGNIAAGIKWLQTTQAPASTQPARPAPAAPAAAARRASHATQAVER